MTHHSQRRFLTKSPIINVMVEAATHAGRFLIKDFNEIDKLKITKKGIKDFVSSADTFSEKNIKGVLEKARPKFGFLMEESGEMVGIDQDSRWIVDPLDGTSNFLHGIPHFCISIALEQKGRIMAAVVYAPLTDEVFWAERGGGAFLNFTRLRVSNQEDPHAMMIGTQPSSNLQQAVSYFGCVRLTGSSALDLAYVAAGKMNGCFYKKIKPWDMAAGLLLIEEAGGYREAYNKKETPMESETLIAGSETAMHGLTKIIRA